MLDVHSSPSIEPLLVASFKRITNNYNIFLRIYRDMCAVPRRGDWLVIMFLLVFVTSAVAPLTLAVR